jgi:predicted dienelactone hydrolase
MAYDPWKRGPFAAGVRTFALSREGRSLPTEVWYPATEEHAGEDLNEATRDTYEMLPGLPPSWQDAVRDARARSGKHPLIAFSHGYGGHRRQSTFLCSHLASHGYVVAAVDHTGNTVFDVLHAVMQLQAGGPRPETDAILREFIEARPADVSFMLDRVLDGDLAEVIDVGRIGMAGHSFGGWTTLVTSTRDQRIRAAVPLAPAGGDSPLPAELLSTALRAGWSRDVPTLFVVADRDTLLPLDGMRGLLQRAPGGTKMVILKDADHMHFCDRIEEIHEMFRLMPQDPLFQPIQAAIPPITELCPGAHAQLAIRGLALAHFDAHLRGSESSARFLSGDVSAALAAQDVNVEVASA